MLTRRALRSLCSRQRRFLHAAIPGASTKYWANQTANEYTESDAARWRDQFAALRGYEWTEISLWRNAFDFFDHDRDGFISMADLQKNPNLSLQKVKLMAEATSQSRIGFGDFVNIVSALDLMDLRSFFSGFDTVDMQLEFNKFATAPGPHEQRVITLERLKDLMRYCDCTCVTDCDARKLLTEIDAKADGVIDYDEFRTWLEDNEEAAEGDGGKTMQSTSD